MIALVIALQVTTSSCGWQGRLWVCNSQQQPTYQQSYDRAYQQTAAAIAAARSNRDAGLGSPAPWTRSTGITTPAAASAMAETRTSIALDLIKDGKCVAAISYAATAEVSGLSEHVASLCTPSPGR